MIMETGVDAVKKAGCSPEQRVPGPEPKAPKTDV